MLRSHRLRRSELIERPLEAEPVVEIAAGARSKLSCLGARVTGIISPGAHGSVGLLTPVGIRAYVGTTLGGDELAAIRVDAAPLGTLGRVEGRIRQAFQEIVSRIALRAPTGGGGAGR